MDYTNLDEALLTTNLMMNVRRAFDEITPQINGSEYSFMEDEDTDDFINIQMEFDFLQETFCRIEAKYEKGYDIDMLTVDYIANDLDLIKHYIESINKPF